MSNCLLENYDWGVRISPVNKSWGVIFNPIQDGLFLGLLTDGGAFLVPHLPKIRHRYPTMIKVTTVIPYLRKIQKMYKSCDTFLEFC